MKNIKMAGWRGFLWSKARRGNRGNHKHSILSRQPMLGTVARIVGEIR
jgi:hypothetical protein